jgi:hypothetical protein
MISIPRLQEFLRQAHIMDSAGRKGLSLVRPKYGKIGHVIYI